MTEGKPIRMALAVDRTLYRRALASMIITFKKVQLVGEARDAAEAIQLCELFGPELIVFDLIDPQIGGKEVISVIHQRWPQVKLVQLVDPQTGLQSLGGLNKDSIYSISKDSSEDEFVDAIQQIYSERQFPGAERTPRLFQAESLQQLVYELQNESLDLAAIADLLSRYLPNIFPGSQLHVRIFPNQALVSHPEQGNDPLTEAAFRWLRTVTVPHCFSPGSDYPWGNRQNPGSTYILSPILQGKQAVGGISVMMNAEHPDVDSTLSVIQTLAAHLSAAMSQAKSQSRQNSGKALVQELTMAGKIQADILPEKTPVIPGWDIAAGLESARETSGDFYDFIPLVNNNWGIVIADVADKGMGAALFMALSSTLFRTFATRYPTLPALAMEVVNERILSDTRGSMFITAFYAVLEPQIARLRYVNAGHPPACLVSTQKGKPIDRLRSTGMALGVMEQAHWQQKIARLAPGDVLLLYTDGITEAQNAHGAYFGDHRLMEVVRANSKLTAQLIKEAVLAEVHNFVGDTPRQDDIALIVLRRGE